MRDGSAHGHVVLVPVKPPALGKSRLLGLSDDVRRDLAAAFALDTVTACLEARLVTQVLVVTDDVALARQVADLGCATTTDGGAVGLNPVLRRASAEAQRRWPALVPVALCADLPSLRADDVDVVVSRLSSLPADLARFVADADGTGTTLYSAPSHHFDPHFGVGSRAAHLGCGTQELTDAPGSVRRDVDDIAALGRAIAMGVGPATSALVPRLGLT